MNRRGFLRSMLRAGVAAAVLPSAATYVRAAWKRPDSQYLFVRSFFYNEPIGCITRANIVCPTAAELETIFAITAEVMPWQETIDRHLMERIAYERTLPRPVHLFDLFRGS